MSEATSLWELRKRPLPRDAIASPAEKAAAFKRMKTDAPILPVSWIVDDAVAEASLSSRCNYRGTKCEQPRVMKQNGTLHTLCAFHRDRSTINQHRFDEKKRSEREETTNVHFAEASVSLPCLYRRNKCGQPRAMKRNGTLHTLCALHRDRSIANQWRFDEKKRKEREQEIEDRAKKNAARRKRRVEQNKAREQTNNDNGPANAALAPLSFKDFDTRVVASFTAATRDGSLAANATENADAMRAWLLPFSLGAVMRPIADAAWRDAAIAQFLQHE